MIYLAARGVYVGGMGATRSLEQLARLVEKRRAILGETMKDAVVATAITVVKSLRAETKIAPKEASDFDYDLYRTGLVGGWRRSGKTFHRVPTLGPGGHSYPGIWPVNYAGRHYLPGEQVEVFRIVPLGAENMTWKKNRHHGCWYVFAQSEDAARRYAREHISRVFRKERGMGQDALGWAMARLSTRSQPQECNGGRARKIAAEAAVVRTNLSGGNFTVHVTDKLDYSVSALKSGKNSLTLAMMRAANSIAGRLRKAAAGPLDADIPTPFPEVTKK